MFVCRVSHTHRQQFSGRGRSSFPFSSICSFPRKNVQKVGGYHTKKLRRSQLLPNPTLEVPITLADARGHDALASAQNMGTSNVGLGSNWPRRGSMAIYGREKNQFMDFTFHFMDRVSFLTGFWRFGESMDELNGKLLLPRPENCCR